MRTQTRNPEWSLTRMSDCRCHELKPPWKLSCPKRDHERNALKNLDGLYEVLAPGSSVVKTDTFTSVIKEPGKRDVTIRNSDLAKFGTKPERQTELQLYANRRPKTPTAKITEDLISHHAKEIRKKLEGGKRMEHQKIAGDISAVSSIHSNVTHAFRLFEYECPQNQNEQL